MAWRCIRVSKKNMYGINWANRITVAGRDFPISKIHPHETFGFLNDATAMVKW
jgi:hypothetical protein